MTDNAPRSSETPDAVLPDLSGEALLDVLEKDENALANCVRTVIGATRRRTENYAGFGNAPLPPA